MKKFSIPYTQLGEEATLYLDKYTSAFQKVLVSGQYILGPEVTAFEKEFANYCGVPFSAGLANGTCALHLVFKGLNLEEDAEIITAPNSFIASASTIALAGAKPVFVDIQPDGNIDPLKILNAITPKTKAIVPVHLTGKPADMPAILKIAKENNLVVVEDAAQAFGASINGQRVGSFGDIGCFSLHPLKNLHAFGDGGMMTCSNVEFLEHMKKARNHGLVNREQCDFWSLNCRLDEIQAAMLRIQLHDYDAQLNRRRALAKRYNAFLSECVEVPNEGPGEVHAYQTYVIKCNRRDELQDYLKSNGVESLIHYGTPIHLQPAAKSLGYSADDFPVTMEHVSKILSLPLYPGLKESDQDTIINLIKNFYS